MIIARSNKLQAFTNELKSFIVPKNEFVPISDSKITNIRTAAIIPTYKPSLLTYKLIISLVKWYPNNQVLLVDDCTPLTAKNLLILKKIYKLAKSNKQVIYLRTPVNSLKAGALNYGIDFLLSQKIKPQVVFTFDDDVKINKDTLLFLIKSLYSKPKNGAICSLALVKNKNSNLLTRLQALEYHNFNISRIADNGFLKGPLVMHGMLTAFKLTALKQVNGFALNHLIEDYDITARLKNAGWQVGVAQNAKAWTEVPEDLASLWKQRVRWSFGGLNVVTQFWRNLRSVFQDLVGHTIFISLFALIMASLVSRQNFNVNQDLVLVVLVMALINFIAGFTYNLVTLLTFAKRDRIDWALKLTLVPELVYCNVLTLILIGSYLFFIYNASISFLANRISIFTNPYKIGLLAFQKIGYSLTWGTRQG